MTAYLDRVAQVDLGGASKRIWGPKYMYFVTTEQILEIREIQFLRNTEMQLRNMTNTDIRYTNVRGMHL